MSNTKKTALADRKMVARAIKDSFVKLDPRIQVKNPVMLLVYIAAILTTVLWAIALFGIRDVMADVYKRQGFVLGVSLRDGLYASALQKTVHSAHEPISQDGKEQQSHSRCV